MASKKDMRRPDLGKSSPQMGDAKFYCASMFDLTNCLSVTVIPYGMIVYLVDQGMLQMLIAIHS
jgi:hypothetical protein